MARHFNNIIDGFMEYCGYVEAPEKFLRWSAISVVAGALERKVWITNGAATWYPNMYIMLVGDAGSRKSTSSEIAVDLLRNVPGVEFLADRLNEATLLAKLKIVGERKHFIAEENEFSHSAAFLYASEAATSFSEMYAGGGIIIALTDLFNCGPRGWHDVHAWTKHTIKDGEIQIFNPCINLLACSTPSWLTTKVMTKIDAEGGFGSRLILVVHKGAYRKNFAWQQAGGQQIGLRLKLIEDLAAINRMCGVFTPDRSFEEGIEFYDKRHTEWLLEHQANSLVSGYQERKITHLIKLSQVLAAAQSDALIIGRQHLDAAWELLSSLEQDMLEAFGELSKTDEMRKIDLLWDYIMLHNLDRVVKAELIARFSDTLSIKEISNTVKDLVEAGRLSFVAHESSLGRLVYRVNRPQTNVVDLTGAAQNRLKS